MLALILIIETVLLTVIAFELTAWAQQTPHVPDWKPQSPHLRMPSQDREGCC